MLDLAYIRDHPNVVKSAAKHKNLNPQIVDEVIKADEKRRSFIVKIQDLKQQRNQLNEKLKANLDKKLMAQSVKLKKQLSDLEPQLKQIEVTLTDLMLQVPNVPLEEVPIGKDESGNKVVKEWGEVPEFDFQPQDHITLGKRLDIIDVDRGAKVAGFRGYFLKNEGVSLAMGLMRFALDKLTAKGFTPIMPPVVDRRTGFVNSGHFPWGEKEAYKLAEDETDQANDYFLAGTAEVPLVSYFANEVLSEQELPIKMVGFSPCFRREIGNYGKDTKGIYRVHEFYKVEQVVIGPADLDSSRQLHEEMLSYSEEILQDLGLHYRVLLMCTGDMGEPQAKKYDIETWMPGRNEYGETGSDSIMTDFQARRANIRYRTSVGLKFVHMLNNTAAPSTRLLIALLENYQQADGSIKLPVALVPYVGKETISPKL